MNATQKLVEKYMSDLIQNDGSELDNAWQLVRKHVSQALCDSESMEEFQGYRIVPLHEYVIKYSDDLPWNFSSNDNFLVLSLGCHWQDWEFKYGVAVDTIFEGTSYQYEDAAEDLVLFCPKGVK